MCVCVCVCVHAMYLEYFMTRWTHYLIVEKFITHGPTFGRLCVCVCVCVDSYVYTHMYIELH